MSMSKLQWDKTGERLYETGLDRGVLYVMGDNSEYEDGVPWNGLTAVNENPSGAESNPLYADNQKYVNLISTEDFGATVEAYTYPEEFEVCDGSAEIATGIIIGQQTRRAFGMAYRTLIGNDVLGQDFGYKIHLIYGAQASPSEKNRQTVNDNPDAVSFSWDVTTTPVAVPGYKTTAHLVIDSTKTTARRLAMLEDVIYGRDYVPGSPIADPIEALNARLPSPEDILTIIRTNSIYTEEPEALCDSSGAQILDSEVAAIQARRMVAIV